MMTMIRVPMLALGLAALAGCVYGPPPGPAYGYGYSYPPSYYAYAPPA